MSNRWLTVGAILAAAGSALAQDGSTTQTPSTPQPPAAVTGNQTQTQPQTQTQTQTQSQTRPAYMPQLMIGDKAPQLTIDTWVKGEPITGFERGRVYVVEFWATWCAPCRESFPHLTQVQSQYKDRGVTVVGVVSSEPDGLEAVVPFVESQGSAIGYTVAWDKDGQTDAAWRKSAGLTSIPAAMIVNNEGFIAWIGNPNAPRAEFDNVLAKVVDGSFDIRTAREHERASLEIMQRAQTLWAEGEQRMSLDVLASMIELDPNRYSSAALQKFQGLLLHLKDADAGYAWANELMAGVYKDNSAVLNEIAWTIVEAPGLESRDLHLALSAVTRAEELTGGKEPAILDTKARVHYAMGNFEEAVALQTRAFELVTDERMKDDVRSRLNQYRSASVDTQPK